MSSDYEVGYRKPPKHSRFKQGQSGNPKGRPKRSKNFKTDVIDTLEATIRIKQNGRTKTVSSQKAALLRLCEKTMSGDPRAMEQFLRLAQIHNGDDLVLDANEAISSVDQDILEAYGKTIRRREESQASAAKPLDTENTEPNAPRALEAAPVADQAVPAEQEEDDDDDWLK